MRQKNTVQLKCVITIAMKIKRAPRIISEEITELSMCEIFVFGSNLAGRHYGGAARTAYEKFGATWGVGVGRSGQTYAIPTMFSSVKAIKPYVDEFISYAKSHPKNRFLLTRIGCGIAGFKDEQMAPLFKDALKLPNVSFPKKWHIILTKDVFIDAVAFGIIPEEEIVPIPEASKTETASDMPTSAISSCSAPATCTCGLTTTHLPNITTGT